MMIKVTISLERFFCVMNYYLLWPCMAMFMFWEWPLVALNPCRFTAFYEWTISLRSDVSYLDGVEGRL